MLVQEFNHQVTVPTDPQSGQPAGQRVHKPFKFTVALNKAVPLMYNALASGEMLPKVTLKWFRTSVEGKQEHFFSTVLTDVTGSTPLPVLLVLTTGVHLSRPKNLAPSYRDIPCILWPICNRPFIPSFLRSVFGCRSFYVLPSPRSDVSCGVIAKHTRGLNYVSFHCTAR